MKVLHVVTLSDLGGSQSVIVSLATELIADGHQVIVAASPKGDLWSILPSEVKKRPIKWLKREISLLNDFQVLRNLRKIFKEFDPDVVHLHSSKIGFLGRLVFPRRKVIYTVHGFDSIRIAFRQYLPCEKILQYRAAHIVAVSKYDYENLLAEGISNNLTYIYNGVIDYKVQSVVSNILPVISYKSSFKKGGGFKVLCIARLAPPKKFDLFCKIALSLIDQNIEFYWVGNKEVSKNLPANVQCLGEIPNAHQLIPKAHIFVLPSCYEGMPVSILEALSYGIPVLASDVGGVKEVLNGNNGVALKNSADIFAKNILKYKNNKLVYDAACAEARQSYLQRFTVGKMYETYLALYTSVLKTES